MIEEEGFEEKWKQIPGFFNYWISDAYRVFDMRELRLLNTLKMNWSARVELQGPGFEVKKTVLEWHRLAFERI